MKKPTRVFYWALYKVTRNGRNKVEFMLGWFVENCLRRVAFALVLLFFSGMVFPGYCQTLELSSVDNIPPYVYKENGELVGISIDIIDELSRRGGFEVVIKVEPWARVLLSVEQGLVDGAFSAYRTEERERFCLYTGIIHYDELRVAVRKGDEFAFTGIESLKGKLIGKGRGVFVSREFDEAVSNGDITLFETNDMKMTNIKMLHEGRLDAIVGSPVSMRDYANKLGYDNIVILPKQLKKAIPAYLVLSKNSDLENKMEWKRKLTELLSVMHADGTIARIYERYGLGRD